MLLPKRLTAVLAAAAIAAAAAATVGRAAWQPVFAHDFEMVCTAAALMARGGNPYDAADLQAAGGAASTPLTFPPLVIRLVKPACGRVPVLGIALAVAGAIIAVTWSLAGTNLLAIASGVTAGFAAYPWVLVTGNVAMFEGLAGAGAFWALVAGRPAVFGVFIGLAAFMKSLMPLMFLVAAVVAWRRNAAKAVAAAVLTTMGLHAVDLAIGASSSLDYWHAYRYDYARWALADLRFASEYNPSIFAFLPIATDHVGLGRSAGLWMAAGVAAMFGVLWLRLWRLAGDSRSERTWLAILAIAVIVVCHPRFKPYSVFVLTPALALGLSRLRGGMQAGAVALACLAPNVLLLTLLGVQTLPPVPVPLLFALQYAQWVCAALVLAFALRAPVYRRLVTVEETP